jgi:predicted nucleic acid-binding protein
VRVFVDTSAYIASLYRKDINHRKALEISQELFDKGADFITSNVVVYEVYTVLARKVEKTTAILFHQKIIDESLPIVYMDEDLEEIAFSIFEKEKSKNVSFFDCTSFAIIKKLQIKSIFSFDRDFERFCKREKIAFNVIP